MILGQDSNSGTAPTASNPVPFQPPAATRAGYVPSRPHPHFMSTNIWPFSQVLNPMRAFPAYHPHHGANVGPHGFPPAPAAVPSTAVATAAPVPAIAATAPSPTPAPAATHGFGGSGFGSHGGVHKHFHVDPYMVMRSGWIPGVSPSGSNIRSGYMNAMARINRSMPFQSHALPPPPPPPPPPAAVAPVPAATHGFGHHHHHHHRRHLADAELGFPGGGFFRRHLGPQGIRPPMPHHRHHHHFHPGYVPPQPVPPPAWAPPVPPAAPQFGAPQGWFMRNFGWRRHHHPHPHVG